MQTGLLVAFSFGYGKELSQRVGRETEKPVRTAEIRDEFYNRNHKYQE
jgi:hypothetical protein